MQFSKHINIYDYAVTQSHLGNYTLHLKPQDSFGKFVKFFLDLQKVDHAIKKHH